MPFPPEPPPPPPDIDEHRALIDQWAAFTADLPEGTIFDLDNWLNDVDIRQLIHEASLMFSPDDLGEHAHKLEAADRAFMLATHAVDKCLWGRKTARREKWKADKNWWYFRATNRSNPQLDEEIERVK